VGILLLIIQNKVLVKLHATFDSTANKLEAYEIAQNHGSVVMLQCYRRQSIPMEQWKIRASAPLYPLN